MDDLQRLLERAAPDDVGSGPYDRIVRRGRRRRARARAVLVGVPALAGLALAATMFLDPSVQRPVIDQPPADPAPPTEDPDGETDGVDIDPSPARELAPDADEHATDPDETVDEIDPFALDAVTVADLGVEVFVVEEDPEEGRYQVRVVTPDGERIVAPDGAALGSVSRLVADGRGGFAWQGPVAESDAERTPIFEVDASGEQRLAVDPDHHAPTFTPVLVGPDLARDGYLVSQEVIDAGPPVDDGEDASGEMSMGYRGDLISVPWAGDHAIVASEVTAWETAFQDALHGDGLVYTQVDGAWTGLDVIPPGGERQRLLDEGDGTGRWFAGIAPGAADHQALVLLAPEPTGPSAGDPAELLAVDLREGEITDRIEVPDLAEEDAIRTADLSRAGDLVLLNRAADGGRWLSPLVMELTTGRWAELEDLQGRAHLSRELDRP